MFIERRALQEVLEPVGRVVNEMTLSLVNI
jgi:hypothetical protein